MHGVIDIIEFSLIQNITNKKSTGDLFVNVTILQYQNCNSTCNITSERIQPLLKISEGQNFSMQNNYSSMSVQNVVCQWHLQDILTLKNVSK